MVHFAAHLSHVLVEEKFSITGSITPLGAEQKANIIVTRVKILITFCVVQNVIQIYNLVRKFDEYAKLYSH